MKGQMLTLRRVFWIRHSSIVLIMLFLVASSLLVGVKPSWANESASTNEDVLAMSTVEQVLLSGNGNARLMIQTELDDGMLADIYRKALGAPSNATVGEEMLIPESKSSEIQFGQNTTSISSPVRSVFYKGVKDEQLSSFGLTTKISNSSMVPNSSTGSLLYFVDAIAFPQVTSVTGSGSNNTWQIRIGPKDENAARKAVGFDLTKVAFAQSMLRSQEGEQRYESFLTMTIVLPEGGTLINANELAGAHWEVSFGGGTYMTASLSIDTSSRIILSEELSVTEQNLTATTNELYNGLNDFGVFEIEYLQPRWASESPEAGLDVSNELTEDFSFPWTFPLFSYSDTLNLIDEDPVHVSLTATVELTLAGYIGWDFGWVWHSWMGISYPLYEPLWFETWVSPQVSATVSFQADVSAVYSKEWEQELFEPIQIPFEFYVGILVTGNIELSLKARVMFNAQAQAKVEIEAYASVGFKAGLRWDQEDGWTEIREPTFSADYTDPDISVEVSASATAGLGFKFALVFYDTLGPVVEFWLNVKAMITVIPVISWNLSLHFEIKAGIAFGDWLRFLLGLDDQTKTLFDETLYEWGGHLGVAPSEISVNVRPSTITPGSPVTIYGSVSSQYLGDKSGAVQVQYSTDNVMWTYLGSASSDASGYYSCSAVLNSEGVYYLRSSWDGNPQYKGATSSPFYPLNVQTSTPWLGFFQTVSLSSNSVTAGQNVVVSSQLYYVILGIEKEYLKNEGTVMLQWSADGILWQNISSGPPLDGYYYGNWTPSKAGTYSLRATYEGYWTGVPLELMSSAASLEVVQAETSLNMFLSATSIEYGQNVTIMTLMFPMLRTVMLEYSFGNSTWYFLSAGNTNFFGLYTFSWAPPIGEYYIRSVWAGDESYFGAESETRLLTVVQPSQYSLSVISPYNTVSGMGLYDVNATAFATLSEGTYDIIPGSVRAVFTGWAGDASGTGLTSDPIAMDDYKTAVATWKIQFYLDVVTDPSNLPAIPGAEWYDNYTRIELEAPRYVPAEEGSMGVRYGFDHWEVDGISQGSESNVLNLTMDVNHVATARYLLQYNIMFFETSVGSDYNGTIATVDGTAYGLADFPLSFWFDNGTSHSFAFASPLQAALSGIRYVWSSTSGLSNQRSGSVIISGSGSVTGNYVTSVTGDVNSDGKIDILDVAAAAAVFGLHEGDVGYNPLVDLAPTIGEIDVFDLVAIVIHFGEEYP